MNIVVVGDILLDVDVDGVATRLCPDAPVPVVDVSGARYRAGGAGLVATMLAEDGHHVILVTVLGADEASTRLEGQLAGLTVVAGPSGAPTPVKTRVRADGNMVVRFDEGCQHAPVPAVTPAMLRALDGAAAIVVADYGRGLTTNPSLRAALTRLAGLIPIIWDPHRGGAPPVAGVAVVTPNWAEARAAAAVLSPAAPSADGPGELARTLMSLWRSNAVLVTQGQHGATLARATAPTVHIAAPKARVVDPCGAGDRLAASLAAQLAAGHDLTESARVAVREAASFLAGGGVEALNGPPRPVSGHSTGRRGGDAAALARRVRRTGGTVVATGGCFDLLHAGHARSLAAARALGDCLIVCLNSDSSVRRIKGASRPIINQLDRVELLLALGCVDAVLVFDEDTPERCLNMLRPDIWVKGGDYDVRELPETPLVESWGGRCLTVPYHPARSTTHLADALARVG
ncbi:PfkB family carbohydrate kinase [Arthrobacter sp. ok362]|uniref:PfkB family carbohydrate kinase n=1 Tax=Arthrobacter sp. ok362 TaxID=1761745 RepID=UPI00088065E3|nr:PfkB family carbohydrate kinase [Arthrobacter sp. ok362]SDK92416.1 rfaE bifunctional protein, domain I/rfaE bifunctional protein, domain II [Arthrobacter sp. ok362]